MALIKIKSESMNLADDYTFTGTVGGVGGGKVGQVVQTVDKTVGTFSLATGTLSSMMTVNITPSATSSKILVRFDCYFGASSNYPYVILRRGTTDIIKSDLAGSRQRTTGAGGFTSGNQLKCLSSEILDSPNSTSQVSYVINVGGYNGDSFHKNRSDDDGDRHTSTCSQITAIEILA